jgi:PPOX class probable F420-dependent enzyme
MINQETLEKLDEFLAPTKIAVVATINKDGMPHLTPVWYIYRNGIISISTTKETIKYKNLTQDNQMSVCVLTEPLAKTYVTIEGTVQIYGDDSIWKTTELIVKRYVEPENVQSLMNALQKPQNRVILELNPDKVFFRQ